jgi:hypothetical protein
MKQGSGTSKAGDGKIEPRSHAISIDKVSGIGLQRVRTFPETKSLHASRGFSAPSPVSDDHHKSGSQGKHR